ncbi:hypothetical protein [Pseudarthrobacter sulfonivorans]|uniref:hypothetical protein n=1 Tax=Pseudarthrobacter sulfonivorans TaxID=121292 RepID=UPI00285936F1|nr:hypothetical protein [Pseudarthrobacter sulfonivorans]MDR6417604.1 hypothetical protein [Pseudarthrobacter sulfonivorans]
MAAPAIGEGNDWPICASRLYPAVLAGEAEKEPVWLCAMHRPAPPLGCPLISHFLLGVG